VSQKEWFAEELQQAIDVQTKNSNFINTSMSLKKVSFEKDVVNKLMNCKSEWNFKQHLLSLRRKGFIGHDDYSFVTFE